MPNSSLVMMGIQKWIYIGICVDTGICLLFVSNLKAPPTGYVNHIQQIY